MRAYVRTCVLACTANAFSLSLSFSLLPLFPLRCIPSQSGHSTPFCVLHGARTSVIASALSCAPSSGSSLVSRRLRHPGGRMEAIAKHDFTATAEDELSFRRNQVLKVGRSLGSNLNFFSFVTWSRWLDLACRSVGPTARRAASRRGGHETTDDPEISTVCSQRRLGRRGRCTLREIDCYYCICILQYVHIRDIYAVDWFRHSKELMRLTINVRTFYCSIVIV